MRTTLKASLVGSILLSLLAPIFSVTAGPNEGFTITSFTISPETVGQDKRFTFTMNANINLTNYSRHCENNNITGYSWDLMMDPSGTSGGSDVVWASGDETFSRNQLDFAITLSRQATVRSSPADATVVNGIADYRVYILIECTRNTVVRDINVTDNSASPAHVKEVTDNQTGLIYACVAADNRYSCSQSNLSSCSDATGCSGRPCTQIAVNQCGQPAGNNPPGGGTGNPPGGGTGNPPGGGTGSGGTTDTYNFTINNPLGGTNETLVDIINLVATWIFNIAIPIAVIIIIWAGLRFLVARGESGEITKAREMLKWAIVGLAIVLIGRGFVALIQSFLELGGSGTPTTQQPPGGNNNPPGGNNNPPGQCIEDERCDQFCVSDPDCGGNQNGTVVMGGVEPNQVRASNGTIDIFGTNFPNGQFTVLNSSGQIVGNFEGALSTQDGTSYITWNLQGRLPPGSYTVRVGNSSQSNLFTVLP